MSMKIYELKLKGIWGLKEVFMEAIMLSNGYIQNQINKLLSDATFKNLEVEQTSFNIFETLGVSHIELWHSGFIKWVLDPKSNLGLSDWPLKRFLSLLVLEGISKKTKLDLSIADIELLNLQDMILETEKNFKVLQEKGGKFDIYAENDNFRLVIENKIKAKERNDQTQKYYKFINNLKDGKKNVLVFLTPDPSQEPKSPYFIKITYQALCDNLLKPLQNNLKESESKYIVSHYINNLGKPLVEGKELSVMALPNKDKCNYLYNEYKQVLDDLFKNVSNKR